MSKNIFEIYRSVKTLPFAASRQNWGNEFMIVITKIEPRGSYGKAYGFWVKNGAPNNHLSYKEWVKNMELPNVGSYQWRHRDLTDKQLNGLVDKFYSGIGKELGFTQPGDVENE